MTTSLSPDGNTDHEVVDTSCQSPNHVVTPTTPILDEVEDELTEDPLFKYALELAVNIIRLSVREIKDAEFMKTSLYRTMHDIDTWIPQGSVGEGGVV